MKNTVAKRRYAKRLSPEDRREQLLDTALRIVAESGFTQVSIASVAERGGVTRPVVYDSFGSREELLDELIGRETDRMRAAVDRAMTELAGAADRIGALRSALKSFLADVQTTPDTWRLVYYPIDGVPPPLRDRVALARDELRTPLRRALGEWQRSLPPATEQPDLEVLVRIVQSLIQTGVRLVLDDPEHFDVVRVLTLLDLVVAEPS